MNGIRQRKQPHAAARPLALDPRPATLDSAKRGFTLVELMVVIVIIALLVGLISAAIFPAMGTARIAEVRTEMSQLETAISAFKAQYGMEPPSHITFPADAAGWDAAGAARSRAIIRRIWPQFDFASNGGGIDPDDGTFTLTGTLNGAECLVFFLGGVRDGTDGPLVGFSKNPATPFAIGGSRVSPFFEFDIGRLTETGGNANAPEFLDSLPSQTNPYIYYSSYDGRGYRTTAPNSELIGGMTDVYRQSSGSAAQKPNSYQIISPGRDADYGTGGAYDADSDSAPSEEDRDNITNFTSGQLVP